DHALEESDITSLSPQSFSISLPGWALKQSPDTVTQQGQTVSLSCSEKISSNIAMYWFKQSLGKDSRLILVVSAVQGSKATIEEEFQSRFQSSEIQGDSLTLFIDQASLNDSGTYYCAESDSQ
uniref:Ig-like domain-containing protein n=1 Tax=Nothoprocta perdicaria TaxID=30464 RepID=A0A8C6Z7L9_NOTPE